jgi:hypothetical protein
MSYTASVSSPDRGRGRFEGEFFLLYKFSETAGARSPIAPIHLTVRAIAVWLKDTPADSRRQCADFIGQRREDLLGEYEGILMFPGATVITIRRMRMRVHSRHHPRKRMIQYSRDADD